MAHDLWTSLGLSVRIIALTFLAGLILPKMFFEAKQENGLSSVKKLLFAFGNCLAVTTTFPILFYFNLVSVELAWMVSNASTAVAVGCLYMIYFKGGK